MRLHQARRPLRQQRVQVDAVDQVQRIQDIALGFRHLLAVRVTNQAVNINLMKWNIVHELQAHHDHSRNPEENDVEPGYQNVARVEGFQRLCFLRPALRAKRPQR